MIKEKIHPPAHAVPPALFPTMAQLSLPRYRTMKLTSHFIPPSVQHSLQILKSKKPATANPILNTFFFPKQVDSIFRKHLIFEIVTLDHVYSFSSWAPLTIVDHF